MRRKNSGDWDDDEADDRRSRRDRLAETKRTNQLILFGGVGVFVVVCGVCGVIVLAVTMGGRAKPQAEVTRPAEPPPPAAPQVPQW